MPSRNPLHLCIYWGDLTGPDGKPMPIADPQRVLSHADRAVIRSQLVWLEDITPHEVLLRIPVDGDWTNTRLVVARLAYSKGTPPAPSRKDKKP